MPLQSMTGFARIEGFNDNAQWTWEIRSVNGKGLDFRFRASAGDESLHSSVRKLVSSYFKRGNLQVNLVVDRPGVEALPVINQPALDAVIAAIAVVQDRLNCAAPSAEQILGIKGVLEIGEAKDSVEESNSLNAALIQDFEKLLAELKSSRTREGLEICDFLSRQLNQLEDLTSIITTDPSRSSEQIKKRITSQLSQLLENSNGIDNDRLHQEVAILVTRSDLTEELDRLSVHIGTARQLLNSEGPVGRKLDFICQEFNRECNTICSKSNAVAVTNAGLDMKVVIDQFREQVQNLE